MIRKLIRIPSGILAFFRDIYLMMVISMPGKTGIRLRQKYYKKRLKFLGEDVEIFHSVTMIHPDLISIGDNAKINVGAVLEAGKACEGDGKKWRIIRGPNKDFEGEIILGKYVHIAPYAVLNGMGGLKVGDYASVGGKASIYTHSQVTKIPSILYSNGCKIQDHVLIGTNSTIVGVSEIKSKEVIRPHSFLSEIFQKKQAVQDGAVITS